VAGFELNGTFLIARFSVGSLWCCHFRVTTLLLIEAEVGLRLRPGLEGAFGLLEGIWGCFSHGMKVVMVKGYC
jgi:hypothetical protein